MIKCLTFTGCGWHTADQAAQDAETQFNTWLEAQTAAVQILQFHTASTHVHFEVDLIPHDEHTHTITTLIFIDDDPDPLSDPPRQPDPLEMIA
jgi:hypothetical protein